MLRDRFVADRSVVKRLIEKVTRLYYLLSDMIQKSKTTSICVYFKIMKTFTAYY